MSWGAVSNDEGLIVYQKALQFVMALYGVCAVLPSSEKENLTQLLKKAAVAVTTHISESSRKKTIPDKTRSLQNAMGYLEECGYYMNLAEQLGYVDTSAEKTQLKEVNNLLEEYIATVADG